MTIETSRLLLRRYEEKDLKDYWQYVSSPAVGPNCGWQPYTDLEKAKERLTYEISNKGQYAIVLKGTGKVIGSIEIMSPDKDADAKANAKEIGYISNPKYWGNGYMTEALKAIIKVCMDKLNTDEVISGYYQPNIGSGRVQEKAGMSTYKTVKDMIMWHETGQYCDGIYKKITRTQYLQSEIYKNLEIKIIDENEKEKI